MITLALSLLTLLPIAGPDPAPLLKNVSAIASPGSPGSIATWGPDAAAVVCGKVEHDLLAPVVAASTLGQGRVVAFSHSGFGDAGTLTGPGSGETAQLMRNALGWVVPAAVRQEGGAAKIRVGVHAGNLEGWLRGEGFEVKKLEGREWAQQLEQVDALCVFTASLTDGQVLAIAKFVRGGGGLIVAQTGWGWRQLAGNPPPAMGENKLNQLLSPAGLAWTDETVEDTAPDAFDAKALPPALASGGAALELILSDAAAPPPAPLPAPAGRSEADFRQAASTALRAARALPASDELVRPRLQKELEGNTTSLIPTAKKPLGRKDARARFLLGYQIDQAEHLSPEEVRAHPASAEFPGAVAAGVARVRREVMIDTSVPGRHSLGLYAPAGGLVTVTIPGGAAEAKGPRMSARIGAHSDQLWHLEKWSRVPDVSMSVPIQGATTKLASTMGGVFYIEVPEGCKLGTASVVIAGCVESPLFVLGTTTPQDWAKQRELAGPWAELATSKVILTVPTAEIRGLENPAELMKFWDSVLDYVADLAAIPHERKRPERYVADVQISAGYMHSGYPIMTHLDAASHMVSLERMRGGAWGLFHELGHNHQAREWTFDGTGEVTCNLFSLYICQELCGISDAAAHGSFKNTAEYVGPYLALRDKEARAATPEAKAAEQRARFQKWKANPFLALEMYRQLAKQFGWETYNKVFAEYRALPAGERPKGDEQERDQWMVRFSRACGRNLGPFFEAWGVPTSEGARESVKELPVWMPEGMDGK